MSLLAHCGRPPLIHFPHVFSSDSFIHWHRADDIGLAVIVTLEWPHWYCTQTPHWQSMWLRCTASREPAVLLVQPAIPQKSVLQYSDDVSFACVGTQISHMWMFRESFLVDRGVCQTNAWSGLLTFDFWCSFPLHMCKYCTGLCTCDWVCSVFKSWIGLTCKFAVMTSVFLQLLIQHCFPSIIEKMWYTYRLIQLVC